MNIWQPIATAPKDGTIVLGCEWMSGKHIVVEIQWAKDHHGDYEWQLASTIWADESYSADPTHWMPRPGPPRKES